MNDPVSLAVLIGASLVLLLFIACCVLVILDEEVHFQTGAQPVLHRQPDIVAVALSPQQPHYVGRAVATVPQSTVGSAPSVEEEREEDTQEQLA